MTVRLLFGRPKPGVVGETRRVVHVFEMPRENSIPARLTAFCSTSFGPGELELLDRPLGMPCESCLRRTPTPDSELPSAQNRPLPAGSPEA
jgi:hypothetical protein